MFHISVKPAKENGKQLDESLHYEGGNALIGFFLIKLSLKPVQCTDFEKSSEKNNKIKILKKLKKPSSRV